MSVLEVYDLDIILLHHKDMGDGNRYCIME